MKKGILYLIPSSLGEHSPAGIIPSQTHDILRGLDSFIVEELRTARRFLRKAGYTKDLNQVIFQVFNEHSDRAAAGEYLKPMMEGKDTGLLSEAGTPCIADPGWEIVEWAHMAGIRVVPLTGPNSLILALMASGFNGQHFTFHGYLPVDAAGRQKKIRDLERDARDNGSVQIFIETPYRNKIMLDALIRTCRPDTRLCIAVDLTWPDEVIKTLPVSQWQNQSINLHKRPAVFLISG